MKKLILSLVLMAGAFGAQASVNITNVEGWFESGFITWEPVSGATSYAVYYRAEGASDYTQLDSELVRQYPDYYRADVVGIKAGNYQFKVIASTGDAAESAVFTATAHDRSGFAHVDMADGIGAYKNDGTLKDGAKVIYVYADNAKTVSTDVITSSKGATTTATGLQDIVYYYQKGYDTTPLDIRIIGTIKAADMDRFDSSEEGLQIKGKNAYANMPITIEGIGNDATISGFGILVRNCKGIELRNFAIMLCMDDCVSLDTDNSHIWVHNMDFFYGNTGGDADQAKGDGTVDTKGESTHVTMSYCHFYDCGKSSLGGMKGETTSCWNTYHHNWFDHSDSRHPRIRTMFYHVYNNYFDGISKYGIGVTMGGSAFVENNYFRNAKYPMLSSKQGSDAMGDGTFSGENGGVIKAYNNTIVNQYRLFYYGSSNSSTGAWDAYAVTDRATEVPSTVVAYTGQTEYNNAADEAARTQYIENHMDDPNDIPVIVRGTLGAGRMQHGDFTWTFNNSKQDENYSVISELKTALQQYQSTLIGFADGTAISNGGATATVNGGDGVGLDLAVNDSYVPSWAGGGTIIDNPEDPDTEYEAVWGSDNDFFWFNSADSAEVTQMYKDGTIIGGDFQPSFTVKKSDGTICSDKTGSIRVSKSSDVTFYYPDGIGKISFYVSGNGSQSWKIQSSDDGSSYTDVTSVSGKAGEHPTLASSFSTPVKYVRLYNGATGTRDVQGIKLFKAVSTGIEEVVIEDMTSGNNTVYDLSGRRVSATRPNGIYVVNGKLRIQKH
ncbi:MAG: pectate lyase [Bacteroidales bacterium]|nr:pectate lyase [Bacteroidales bacterium]